MKTTNLLLALLTMLLLVVLPQTLKAQNTNQPPNYRTSQFLNNQAYDWTAEAQRVLLAASVHTYTDNGMSTTSVKVDSLGFTPLSIFIKNDATATDTLYFSNSSLFPSKTTYKLIGTESMNIPVAWNIVYVKFGYIPVAAKAYRLYAY
jgi:hypothetical protein